jgi:hypothetical protein
MHLKLLFSLSLLVIVNFCSAQVWKPLGPSDTNRPYKGVAFSFSTTTHNDEIWAVFQQYSINKASVRKYASGVWQDVGMPGISAGATEEACIAVSAAGTPYVCYRDMAHNSRITVKKFNGTAWANVGLQGFSDGYAANLNIGVFSNGRPCVSYIDTTLGGKLIVKSFNGTGWVNAGPDGVAWPNGAKTPSFLIDSNNMPIVAFVLTDSSNPRIIVRKYDGTSWLDLGGPTYATSYCGKPQLALFNDGRLLMCYGDLIGAKLRSFYNGAWLPGDTLLSASNPLIAIGPGNTIYQEYATSQGYFVRKSTQSSWQMLGNMSFIPISLNVDTGGIANLVCHPNNNLTVVRYENGIFKLLEGEGLMENSVFPAFALDSHGTPYMFGSDSSLGGNGTLRKFDGAAWVNVGPPGFTDGPVSNCAIIFDKDDVPYVCYNPYSTNVTTKVQRYLGGNWEYPGFMEQIPYISSPVLKSDAQGGIFIGGFFEGAPFIMKYNGAYWAEFTQLNLGNKNEDQILSFSFDVSKDGTPYVCYVIFNDEAGYQAIRTRYFDGGAWKDVSSPVSSNATNGIIAVDTAGRPWVVLEEYSAGGLMVKKFDGNTWVNVTSNPWAGGAESIAIDKSNNVFIGYTQGAIAAVKKYSDQNGWEDLGEVSYSIAYRTAVCVSDNNPVLAVYNYDCYAWQYTGAPTSINSLSGIPKGSFNLYPNPATETVIIDLGETQFKSVIVTISAIDGKLLFSRELNQTKGNKMEMPIGNLSPGMYMVTVKGEHFTSTKKLIKN